MSNTKHSKFVGEIVEDLKKDRAEKRRANIVAKEAAAQALKDLKDKGWDRAIITESPSRLTEEDIIGTPEDTIPGPEIIDEVDEQKEFDLSKELLKENQELNTQLENERKQADEERKKAEEELAKARRERDKLLKEIEEAKQDAIKAQQTLTKKFEDYVNAIEDIPADWVNAYEEATGKKAIWHGEITNGFKEFIEKNGFLK